VIRFIPLPPGVPEALLLIVIIGVIALVARGIRRRRAFAPTESDTELPTLTTDQRVRGIVRRVHRDPAQGVWLVEVSLGRRRLTFCATDYAAVAERYTSLVGKEADIALYGLATLATGGADAIRDQIKDADKVEITPELVRLIPTGQFANDHVVIGRVLSHQDEEMSGLPVTVYRTQVVRTDDLTLVLELAVERAANTPAFVDGMMVHGSARLYGYLA
jgi:hypothetical protein